MTKLLPIVPGCLAYTHGCIVPENNGIVVKVGEFIGTPPLPEGITHWVHNDYWSIDKKIIYKSLKLNQNIGGHYCLSESKLMRIDGYEEDKDITEIAKELVHD